MAVSARADDYLSAASVAIALASDDRVASSWSEPSALAHWSVGGLAAHLLGQVFSVTATLANPVTDLATVPMMAHYTRVPWRGAELDEPSNAQIRAGGDDQPEVGAAQLTARATLELAELARALPVMPGDRVVQPLWTQWSLTLDDFLTSRLMEIAVHSDDLAVSVGVETPALPDGAARTVRHLLIDLAAERHGDSAVVRALARVERAPGSIAAL